MNLSSKAVDEQVAGLDALSRDQLVEQWIKLYRAPPFKGMRHQTLVRGISYKLQEKTFGSLKPVTRRELLRLAEAKQQNGVGGETTLPQLRPRLQIGSKLIREWNGRTYEVVVSDASFILNGVKHPSLSACAKAITGAHWSGPRFFGVAS